MGIFLSVLVASVGAMDVINCLAFFANQLTGPPAPADQDLERYRQLLKEQIEKAPKSSVEGLTYAQDGVMYKDGYRVETFDEARLDQLQVSIKELEQRSQEKDQILDRLNVKLQELERRSVEREIEIDELRSRSVSRMESPEPTSSRMSNSTRDVPQIVLEDDESRRGSSRFRPIHRDDEFRRTIKKRSVASNVSEDRTEELEALSQMEEDEAKQMEDYMPLVYTREDYPDSKTKKHMVSPIQELCQMHEDELRTHIRLERSPEPSFGADISKPWGDIKLEATKEKTLIHLDKDLCIEEEIRDSESSVPEEEECVAIQIEGAHQRLQSPRNTFPELPQLDTEKLLPNSESVPSNLSSHSNSPDPEHPTLKRTRKKSDLTALLLEEERKSEAFSGILIQTEEYDSEGGTRTEFMQSKSPSPYVGPFQENDSPLSTGQLIPLVQESPKSPTPSEQDQSASSVTSLPSVHSRDATISPAPIASSGSPASPVSSIVDEFNKDGIHHVDGGDRFSPVLSERNVSRDGSVSLASTDASAASLDLHVDQALQAASISPPIQQHAAVSVTVDLDDGGVDRKSSVSPIPGGDKQTPPRRFRVRKRAVRSLTPINFDQTFMDHFSEQQLSVSPSELEDYINSMDEIKIDPPKPVTPNYIILTTPITSGVPSLLVTDEKGADARFHDDLSSKSFYGNNQVDPERVLNHRVNYEEWMKKFPENMTSHLELEDYDSDDEEVENIINGSKSTNLSKAISPEPETDVGAFPTSMVSSITPSPESNKDLSMSPEVPAKNNLQVRNEFSLNVETAHITPSPVSQMSEISLSTESIPETSSLALGSPLLNSIPSPSTHFTPITSPISSLKSPTPETHSLSPHPLPRLQISSQSPTHSPIPPNMTPEEAIFDIGHLDGLIFETKSRSPTPLPLTPSAQQTQLSPEELAYDIGNLGGLILGPPSRSVSPLPLSSSPTPGSSLSSGWTSLQAPTLSNDETSHTKSETRKPKTHTDTNTST